MVKTNISKSLIYQNKTIFLTSFLHFDITVVNDDKESPNTLAQDHVKKLK